MGAPKGPSDHPERVSGAYVLPDGLLLRLGQLSVHSTTPFAADKRRGIQTGCCTDPLKPSQLPDGPTGLFGAVRDVVIVRRLGADKNSAAVRSTADPGG